MLPLTLTLRPATESSSVRTTMNCRPQNLVSKTQTRFGVLRLAHLIGFCGLFVLDVQRCGYADFRGDV